MKKYSFKNFVMLSSSGILAIFGMGSNCPGTGSHAEFKNSALVSLANVSVSAHAWHTPYAVDLGQVDVTSACLDTNQNMTLAGANSPYPMSLLHDASGSYSLIFTRDDANGNGTCAARANVNTYVVSNSSVSGSGDWVNSSYSSFINFDATGSVMFGTGIDSQQPTSVVDSAGTSTVVFLSKSSTLTFRQPVASRHDLNDNWTTPVLIGTNTADVTDSLALGADSNNNTMVAWVENAKAYLNMYRPNLGWRYTASAMDWSDSADSGSIGNYGVDLAYDGYGNGYGAYVTTAPVVKVGRWKGNAALQFSGTNTDYQTVSTGSGSPMGYPKLFVAQNGVSRVFFYANQSGNFAELWSARAAAPSPASSATAGLFTAASRVDSSYGAAGQSIYVSDAGTVFPPIVATKNSIGAMAFIKSDGTSQRLYVFKIETDGSLTALGNPDAGGLGYDVNYASIAINASGEVAVVYSGADGAATEIVAANVYSGGRWQGVTQIGGLLGGFTGGTVSDSTRPSISIDDAGVAVASFTMSKTTSFAQRRAVVSIYY